MRTVQSFVLALCLTCLGVNQLSAQFILGAQGSYVSDENAKQWGGGIQAKFMLGGNVALGATLRSYPKNFQETKTMVNNQEVTTRTGNTVTPVAGMLEFYPLRGAFQPYFGADAGLYLNSNFTQVKVGNTATYTDYEHSKKYFGVAPKAGLMLKLGGLLGIFGQLQYHFTFGDGSEKLTVPGINSPIETKPAEKFITLDAGIVLRLGPAGN